MMREDTRQLERARAMLVRLRPRLESRARARARELAEQTTALVEAVLMINVAIDPDRSSALRTERRELERALAGVVHGPICEDVVGAALFDDRLRAVCRGGIEGWCHLGEVIAAFRRGVRRNLDEPNQGQATDARVRLCAALAALLDALDALAERERRAHDELDALMPSVLGALADLVVPSWFKTAEIAKMVGEWEIDLVGTALAQLAERSLEGILSYSPVAGRWRLLPLDIVAVEDELKRQAAAERAALRDDPRDVPGYHHALTRLGGLLGSHAGPFDELTLRAKLVELGRNERAKREAALRAVRLNLGQYRDPAQQSRQPLVLARIVEHLARRDFGAARDALVMLATEAKVDASSRVPPGVLVSGRGAVGPGDAIIVRLDRAEAERQARQSYDDPRRVDLLRMLARGPVGLPRSAVVLLGVARAALTHVPLHELQRVDDVFTATLEAPPSGGAPEGVELLHAVLATALQAASPVVVSNGPVYQLAFLSWRGAGDIVVRGEGALVVERDEAEGVRLARASLLELTTEWESLPGLSVPGRLRWRVMPGAIALTPWREWIRRT